MARLSFKRLQVFRPTVKERIDTGIIPSISLNGEKVSGRVPDINDDPGLPGSFDFYMFIHPNHERSTYMR